VNELDQIEEAALEVMEPDNTSAVVEMTGGTAEYREELIKKYHQGASNLVARMRLLLLR